jgi:hypothetical protein
MVEPEPKGEAGLFVPKVFPGELLNDGRELPPGVLYEEVVWVRGDDGRLLLGLLPELP